MADAQMDTASIEATSPEALLELILTKEDEIKQRVRDAQTESDRIVEEAKLEASMIKRDAAASEVGTDIKEKSSPRRRPRRRGSWRRSAARRTRSGIGATPE